MNILKLLEKINDKAVELNQKAFRKTYNSYRKARYIALYARYFMKIEKILYKDGVYTLSSRILYKLKGTPRVLKEECKPYVSDDVPVLRHSEYPDKVSLNRFLRENYDDIYPQYIESVFGRIHKVDGVYYSRILLKLVAITEEELPVEGTIQLANSKGVLYTYEEYLA